MIAPPIDELDEVMPRIVVPTAAQRREAVQTLGLAYYIAGRVADSIPFLEQTAAHAPNNHELTYALGMDYLQTRRTAKARESFARMFRLAPDSARLT